MTRHDEGDAAWLRRMAAAEGDGVFSVGGLAATLAEAAEPGPQREDFVRALRDDGAKRGEASVAKPPA